MKDKEAYVGQPVAMTISPRRQLGTIVAIAGKIAHVSIGNVEGAEQYIALYGLKVLVEYVE